MSRDGVLPFGRSRQSGGERRLGPDMSSEALPPVPRPRRGVIGTIKNDAGALLQSVINEMVPGVVGAVDVNDVVERLDIQAVLDRVDINALLDQVDLQSVIDRIDLDDVL